MDRDPISTTPPAPEGVIARVAAIERVCAEHAVPLKAAALQFPLGHPAIACVLPGARTRAEFDDNRAMANFPIPAGFWKALRDSLAGRRSGALAQRQRMIAITGQVDAHHHVWSLARGDYGWLTPDRKEIYRDFSLADLAPLREAAGITTTVLVQAAPTVAETEFLLKVAKNSDGVVKGVVGWVDLAAADAIPALTRLARNPLLKSIRPMLQDLPDPAWILRADVGRALSALPRLGLRFDALVTPAQLPALLTMLDRHPELAVVIDHGAKPDIAGGMWEPWAQSMRVAASNPRVRCKLSGLLSEAATELRPSKRCDPTSTTCSTASAPSA